MPSESEEGCCKCIYKHTCKKICSCLFCIILDVLLCPCKCCINCLKSTCYDKCCCNKPPAVK